MKIKELTLKQRYDICNTHPGRCYACPIQGRFCLLKCSQQEMQEIINELEKEIEIIDEQEKTN